MKCTFVAMGSENISLQALSAMLKQGGHETTLAFDQALFDDKNYLMMPWLARLFDHRDVVLAQVERSRPQLVAFSVLTPTYQWALDMARAIKARMDVPILFGGIHPSTLPEQVIANDCVDIICLGEGDHAILELCDSIQAGAVDTSIRNLWFKRGGQVIRNEQRPVIADLDALPVPDKALFAPHVPIRNYYLAVTARGCPFTCAYCECSFMAEEVRRLGGKRLRERSPDSVIRELREMRERYRFSWVDFRNNTFTATPRWVREFLPRYKAEIGLPFRIFAHPLTIDEATAAMLKEAGCFSVQLGIESMDPWVRSEVMNRHETNDEILAAVSAMDRVGLPYSCDYILGVPGQTERELEEAARFFADRTACYRVSSFMLAYQPKLKINEKGIELGDITPQEIAEMEQGRHHHYVAGGSVSKNPRLLRHYNAYRLLFRLIPMLPRALSRLLIDCKAVRLFRHLPVDAILRWLDLLMLLRPTDKDARTYARNYWYWFISRFDRNHPAYRRPAGTERP